MKTTTAKNGKETKIAIFRVALEKEPRVLIKEKVFTTIKEAEDYYENLQEEVGYYKVMDRIEILKVKDMEVEDFLYLNEPYKIERIKEGGVYLGKTLNADGVIIAYIQKKYFNYAFKICSINFVKNTRLYQEADLICEANYSFLYFETMEDFVKEYNNKVGVFSKICGGEDILKDFIRNFKNIKL